MFAGHYGVSFLMRRLDPRTPLWHQFVAVQLLDVFWAIFVLLGIERLRVAPGITASSPLDLVYVPYTHSLLAALLWSAAVFLLYRAIPRPVSNPWRASLLIAVAVASHWPLDLLVHRPDLPLWDDHVKLGLGLWNHPALSYLLEVTLLLGGILVCMRGRTPPPKTRVALLGTILLLLQTATVLAPAPASPQSAVSASLITYLAMAAIAWRVDRTPTPPPARGTLPSVEG